MEAHILWHQSLEKYHESDAFLANLNATIEALRNVTFVLQKERSVPDFDAWYSGWQAKLKGDPAAKWLQEARTKVVHQGELKSQSSAEIRLVSWRDQVLASIPIPAEIPSSLVLQSLPLLDLLGKSGASVVDAKNSSIAIERRWSAAGLSGREILETLAQVYGLLCDIVLDAHVALKRCECIPKEDDHPDFRSTYHRTGTLECMVAGAEKRIQRFDCSGDELEPVVISRSMTPEEIVAANRYEFPEEGEIAAWQRSDPAQVTETILYRAKRILCKDRCHPRIMFIRDGHAESRNYSVPNPPRPKASPPNA